MKDRCQRNERSKNTIATFLAAHAMNIWFCKIYSIKVHCTNSGKVAVIFSDILFCGYLSFICTFLSVEWIKGDYFASLLIVTITVKYIYINRNRSSDLEINEYTKTLQTFLILLSTVFSFDCLASFARPLAKHV
jgi:hypothetical protein